MLNIFYNFAKSIFSMARVSGDDSPTIFEVFSIKSIIIDLFYIYAKYFWKFYDEIALHRGSSSGKTGIGDVFLLNAVAREIKTRNPQKVITVFADYSDTWVQLFQNNPNIDRIAFSREDIPESAINLHFRYEPTFKKNRFCKKHILDIFCDQLRIKCKHKLDVFLTEEEKEKAQEFAEKHGPYITLNTQPSNWTPNKKWFTPRWQEVVNNWATKYNIVHLGSNNEPHYSNVLRLVGKTNIRDCFVVLSNAKFHLGIVSFLMHAANGVDTPSVIIYGGYENPSTSSYSNTKPLYSDIHCSPCWLTDNSPYGLECMKRITVDNVNKKIEELLREIDSD